MTTSAAHPPAADLQANVAIRASAGTGKTFQLSNRFLALADSGEQPDRILATTFARKAAGEILDRVLTRLAEAAVDPAKREELAEHIGNPQLDRERCLQLLRQLIGHLHRLRIGTLDSFFVQIAGSFGLELGLPPGWGILDEIDDEALRSEAVRDVLAGDSASDLKALMHLLSKGEVARSVSEQIRSVTNALYALYLETGPDAWSALQRPKPLEEHELEAALDRLAGIDEFPDNRFAKARDQDVQRARDADWEGFVTTGIAKKLVQGEDAFYTKPIPADLQEAYAPLIRHARAVLVGKIANQTEATRRLLEKYDRAYTARKRQQRGFRFDDLTRLLADEWATGDVDATAHRLDGHIRHLLLDEFQDTSLGQWRVIRPLARASARTPGRSFFCVGDVKQAIYGWRGGLADLFDALPDELDDMQTAELARSFRSSPQVIETVNAVFGNLPGNAALANDAEVGQLWNERFQEHTTARTELRGHCRLLAAPRAGENDDQTELHWDFAAAEIARLHRRYPGRSIGVLVRRNKAVAPLIYHLRHDHGVRASEEGGNPLTDSAAVQAILSLLKLADHPGDTIARFHVAGSPLGKIVGYTDHTDDGAAARLALDVRERLIGDGYGRTLYAWAKRLAAVCNERELRRLLQLVELAYGFRPRRSGRPDEFISRVRSQRVEDPTAADVRVMTVHQAKGLQFDIVVLPELDVSYRERHADIVVERPKPTEPVSAVCRYVSQNLLPLFPERIQTMFAESRKQDVHESLCVLYVALTRAVHALHMIVGPSKENERKIPGTFAGLLRAALTDGQPAEPEAVLYETGTPEWAEGSGVRGQESEVRRDESDSSLTTHHSSCKVRLAPSPARRSRGLERTSPSALQGGTRVDLQRRMRLDSAWALGRGTLWHAWFEQIAWLDDGPPDDETLRRAARRLTDAGAEIGNMNLDAQIAEFRGILEQPTVSRTLSREGYADPATLDLPQDVLDALQGGEIEPEVHRERRFAVRDGETLTQGTIDRVVVLRRDGRPVAADVIDFKTDALPDDADEADALVEHYRPQLAAYREAVARQFALEPRRIAARLLFVEADAVRMV